MTHIQTIPDFIHNRARMLVAAWTREHIAHGGAVDVIEVANSTHSADSLALEALYTSEDMHHFVEVFPQHGRAALEIAFERFLQVCLEQAEAIEARIAAQDELDERANAEEAARDADPLAALREAYEEFEPGSGRFCDYVWTHCGYQITNSQIQAIGRHADTPEQFHRTWEDTDWWVDN